MLRLRSATVERTCAAFSSVLTQRFVSRLAHESFPFIDTPSARFFPLNPHFREKTIFGQLCKRRKWLYIIFLYIFPSYVRTTLEKRKKSVLSCAMRKIAIKYFKIKFLKAHEFCTNTHECVQKCTNIVLVRIFDFSARFAQSLCACNVRIFR